MLRKAPRATHEVIPLHSGNAREDAVLEFGSRSLVVVLLVMLSAVTVQALWKLGEMIFHQNTPYPALPSYIVFVLILAELYRTLIFYLREHCVSVVLIMEVAIVSTVQELIFKSAHEFHPQRAFGGALLLLVLDGLLALERFFGRLIGASDTSAH